MSDGVHLLVPFAYSGSDGCAQALGTLALPQLEKLLARLAPVATDIGEASALSMPHERVLARELGLPVTDGCIPWAAWQINQAGRDATGAAWAWITPCHWRVGTDHVAMGHPGELQLDPGDAQVLLSAMRPFFEEDAIALEYEAPTLWRARGEVFRGLAAASLDRVAGRTVDAWVPRAAQARTLRRLQQEMQMLLYTHEVNERRERAGLLAVNSFWVSGAGVLPAAHADAPPPGLTVTQSLREPALRGDWPGWAAAWRQLDSKECASLLPLLASRQSVSLTLCGERNAQTWATPSQPRYFREIASRLGDLAGRKKATALLETL